jgi:hypothetical protein
MLLFSHIYLNFSIGDSMGSVIGYDALCRSPDSHSSHDASRHSTPEHVPKKSDNGINKYYEILKISNDSLLNYFR